MRQIKRVFRKAKPADLEKYREAQAREHDTMIRARRIAEKLGLNMKIGDVEYQGDGNKATTRSQSPAGMSASQSWQVSFPRGSPEHAAHPAHPSRVHPSPMHPALSYPGVIKTYAIQAGRELRVIVGADKIDDAETEKLSAEIVAYLGLFLVFFGEFHTEQCVGQFGFFVGHFAYVVQQARAPCLFGVEAEFGSHDGAEVGCFAGVLQQVLPVAGAVFHLAHEADEVGV